MKQNQQTLRIAAVALFATAAFVNAPVFGQEVPTVAPPSPVQVAPPPPAAAIPPPVILPTPAPRAAPSPQQRATESTQQPRQAQREPRQAERGTRSAASRPAPAAPAAAATEAPVAAPAPVPSETAPPATVAAEPTQPSGGVAVIDSGDSTLTWLVGGGLALVIALAAFVFLRRRRVTDEDYHEEALAHEEPAVLAEPVVPTSDYQPALVTPAFRRSASAPVAEPEVVAAAGLSLAEADRADMDALSASSHPEGHRPWLEFLMRPIRAGTTEDETVVEFELTVGNTGTVSAEDVRISTWMVASGEGSEMERSLIEPPAGAASSETRIAPGDGAKVDATIALPRARLKDDGLTVVVADARYTLPGGGEGRTSARFAVGLPSGDGLAPFAVALGEGLSDDVEARVEGEPEHV